MFSPSTVASVHRRSWLPAGVIYKVPLYRTVVNTVKREFDAGLSVAVIPNFAEMINPNIIVGDPTGVMFAFSGTRRVQVACGDLVQRKRAFLAG